MYPRYLPYKPEELNALQIFWLQMKEDKIRRRRKAERVFTDSSIQNLKRQMELESKPLSLEEQKEMRAFEKMMLVEMSFGNNLENSDIV